MESAHGARWRGERVGSFGVAAGFAIPPKLEPSVMPVWSPVVLEHAARQSLRQYGWEQPAISEEPGVNSRLDPLQAAILRSSCPLKLIISIERRLRRFPRRASAGRGRVRLFRRMGLSLCSTNLLFSFLH